MRLCIRTFTEEVETQLRAVGTITDAEQSGGLTWVTLDCSPDAVAHLWPNVQPAEAPMLHRYLCDADKARPVQTVAYDRAPTETLYKAVVVDDADAVLRCAFYGSGEYTIDNGVVSIKAGAVPCVVESYADAAILWYGEDGNVVARKGMEGKGLAVNAGTVPVDAGEVVKDIVKRWSP